MTTTFPLPPFDPALRDIAQQGVPVAPMNAELLAVMRQQTEQGAAVIQAELDRHDVTLREITIPGPAGDIILAVVSPAAGAVDAPAIYNIHGGGMIMGDRYTNMADYHLIEWVAKFGLVVVSVEYRKAPEARDDEPVEDCYAGLVWTAANAAELGIDPNRIILAGASGGGGLAAGTALLARDKGGPALIGQALWCPQLEDAGDTVSAHQVDGPQAFGWTRQYHRFAFTSLLGEGYEQRTDVSIYASAFRAQDLSGLPPAFIDVGSSELFRDAATMYAMRLWAHGVQAELHVWPGGFHGFDMFAPTVPISVASRRAQEEWVARLLDGTSN
jgi:acetyl esterase/lipase